jgi:hypothetical protein
MVNKVSKNKLHKLVNKIIENKNLKLILKYCCKRGNSLLHILINEADIEGFKAIMCIIKEVNKVNKKLIQQIINLQNKAGDTPAHIAVRKSNNKNNIFSIMVETLQSVGADFSISNNNNEVIAQSGEPKYNEEQTIKQKYINSCAYDNINNNNNNDTDDNDNDNVTTEDLDNIQTTNSPLPFKLEIFVLDQIQKQNKNKNQEYKQQLQEELLLQKQNQKQNQNQNQDYQQENEDQREEKLEQLIKQKLEERFRQKQMFKEQFIGGNNEAEPNEDSETSDSNGDIFYGGGGGSGKENISKEVIKGNRQINNPYISLNGGSKISEKNHNEAIELIIKLGYTEEEAKDIKNFLYYEIKDRYPDKNNDERSKQLLKDIETLQEMNIKTVRKELEKYRERNEKSKGSKKEHSKEHSKEPKKTSKTSKTSKPSKPSKRQSSKKTSKRQSSKKTSKRSSYKKH